MNITLNELLAMAPQLILVCGGLLVLLAQITLKKEGRNRTTFSIASMTVLIAFIVVIFGLSDASGTKTLLPRAFFGADAVLAFNNSFRYSTYSGNVLVLLLALALGVLALMRTTLPKLGIDFAENHFLLLMSLSGYAYAVCAEDLITLFVALELGTVPIIVLIGMHRDSAAANEAAIKYLLLSAFTVAFFLLGIALLYASSSTVRLRELREIGPHYTKTRVVVLAYLFLFVGFLFKLGAVPLHSYIADVYEGATTAFTALLASLSKVASVLVFFKVALSVHDGYRQYFAPIVTSVAIASMFYGAFAAIGTRNLKRLLAYSSISHAGFMLCFFVTPRSLDAGLVGTVKQEAGSALFIYAASYAAASLLAFSAVALAEQSADQNGQQTITLDNLAGRSARLTTIAMTFAVLSLMGLPPLAGFLGKFFLFKYCALSGNLPLAAAVGLASAVAMYAYLRILRVLFFAEESSTTENHVPFPQRPEIRLTLWFLLVVLIFFAGTSGFLYNAGIQAVHRIY